MRSERLAASLCAALLAVGCNGGGGSGNAKPVPVIVDPHQDSTHFPGNVDFSGRATDKEDGPLAGSSLRWEVYNADDALVAALPADADGDATIPVNVIGEYVAVLYAVDSKGKEGRATQPFKVGNTVAEITDPNNEGLVGISTLFDVDGDVETRAPGVAISMMTFIGTDLSDDSQIFSQPVAASTAVCSDATLTHCTPSVTWSFLAGRFRIRLEVTTTLASEVAEDNVFVNADAAPVVSITSPAPGSRVVPGTAISFTGIATDAGGDELDVVWRSSIDGTINTQTTAEGGGALESFTHGALSLSKHQIVLEATDPLGLVGRATIDLYIENTADPLFANANLSGGGVDTDVQALAADGALIWTASAGDIHSVGTTSLAITNVFPPTGQPAAALLSSIGERLFATQGGAVDVLSAGAGPVLSNFAPGGLDANVNGLSQASAAGGSYLYYATDNGVFRTDANRAGGVNSANGALGNNPLFSVAAGAGNVVWVGSDGDGLIRADFTNLPPALTQVTVASDVVRAIHVDSTGLVWAGTDDGLSRYDPVAGIVTTWKDPLPDGNVRAVTVDAGGIVWIGTEDGAARFDPANDRWTTFTSPSDLPSRRVRAIVIDADGNKWFGCADDGGNQGGLTRYNGI